MREAQTLRTARRAGLHKRMTAREDSGCEEARKTGDTTRVGAGICRRFTLVCARGGALASSSIEKRSVWAERQRRPLAGRETG